MIFDIEVDDSDSVLGDLVKITCMGTKCDRWSVETEVFAREWGDQILDDVIDHLRAKHEK